MENSSTAVCPSPNTTAPPSSSVLTSDSTVSDVSPQPAQSQMQPLPTNAAPSVPTTTPAPQKHAGPQKRGNPGKFQGDHLDFLQARIKGYLDLSVRHEKSQWIATLTHEWFEKYPWHTRSEPAEFAVLHDSNITLP
ncbi:hypothetical protein F5878DRAFT_660403, partial [Lentinula raphanica]